MSRPRPPRALAIAAAVSATVAAPFVSASQRYASAAASIAPVPMASSCAAPAAHEVDTGAAWLLVRAPDAARAAFDRAADLDPDCALAYWGRAVARLDAAGASGGSPAAIAALLSDISRAGAVPARTPFERVAVAALQRLAAREAAPGVPAAWPIRVAAYRDAICAGAPDAIWCGFALAGEPGPQAGAERALRWVVDHAREAPLDLGAAVIVLETAPDPQAPIVERALAAVSAQDPPAPVPHALAARVAARRGAWAAAVTAAGRVQASAPDAVSRAAAADAALEALLQLGRRTDAYALARTAVLVAADAPAPARDDAARAWARVALGDRRLDGRGLADRTALQLDGGVAARWPVVFVTGLDAALRAWPGGDRARLAEARAAAITLDDLGGGDPRSEIAWARAVLEAAIAASQDEHQQMALFFTHAADLEAHLVADGRIALPLVPTRELAAELWLRTYRYDDARREARAVASALPRRVSPAIVLARTAARLQDPTAAELWRAVLDLRASADANDSLRLEARQALDAVK